MLVHTKKAIKAFAKLCISGIISLALLSLFVLVYEHTGVLVDNPSGATDYKWAPYQLQTTMTEGFAWLKFDENGFNNPKNCLDKELDILFMGSSHIEGTHIAEDESVTAQLRNELPDLSVYNIGISSHTIYKNVNNLKNAVAEYDPSKYVIIQTSNCDLSDTMIEAVLSGNYSEKPSFFSGPRLYILKYCPAIKSIIKNVQYWESIEKNSEDPQAETVTASSQNIDSFLGKIKKECGNCQPIIVFNPIVSLAENGTLDISSDGVELFEQTCRQNGILFVDLSEDFRQLYDDSDILPYGFSNTGVGAGHLNKYGCELMAKRLAEVIKEDQK